LSFIHNLPFDFENLYNYLKMYITKKEDNLILICYFALPITNNNIENNYQ